MGKKAKLAKKLGCCEAFRDHRGKACKGCPLMAALSKQQRRALKDRYR